MSDRTLSQVDEHEDVPKECQSWGSVARYVIMQLARAVPYALMVWQAYIRHLRRACLLRRLVLVLVHPD